MSANFESATQSSSSAKPRLAITVGDAAGVGPELALKSAMSDSVLQSCHPILVGPAEVLRVLAGRLSLSLPPIVAKDEAVSAEGNGALLIDVGRVSADGLVPGQFSEMTGQASFEAVEWAIAETMRGAFDAIVTGPIQKEAWHAAGTDYLGHTELLADRTMTQDYSMMLSGRECSTVLATIHLPILDAVQTLSIETIARAIRLGGEAMEKRYGRTPRITVLGLNPHAGENGLLSHGEEENLIRPAIDLVLRESASRGRNWAITGPVPPDTAFTPAMRAATDVHVCMYHDQGLIPLKALSFDDAVNVTLGLPIVRTSVDHGTAMDLAWKGTASPNSMLSAIKMAVELSK